VKNEEIYLRCKPIYSLKQVLDHNYSQIKRVPMSKNSLNTPLTVQTFGKTPPSKKKSDYVIQSAPDCVFGGF
jgi:hypothetical protein